MDITDLDDIVENWAADLYGNAEGLSLTSNRTPYFEIDYTNVRFSAADNSETSTPLNIPQRQPTVIFTSNHDNNTDQVQDHTFKMEHKVQAAVKTSLTKGFISRKGKMGLKIKVPEAIRNITADFGTEVAVESEEEKTTTHEVKWGLHTTVKAEPKRRTTAKLTITEKEFECTFTAKIKIRGKVVVRIIDGASPVIPMVGRIAEIVNKKCKRCPSVSVEDGKVFWDLAGSLTFKFGVSQDVQIDSVPLSKPKPGVKQ